MLSNNRPIFQDALNNKSIFQDASNNSPRCYLIIDQLIQSIILDNYVIYSSLLTGFALYKFKWAIAHNISASFRYAPFAHRLAIFIIYKKSLKYHYKGKLFLALYKGKQIQIAPMLSEFFLIQSQPITVPL